ncbi:hypothetical protein CN984_10980 [Bacillus cereus]|uniref:Lipoprotein n=1 Tax=Bacillus cereus TaxID=1396 RepID=A0A2B9Q566_BACCE|nr:hypothetical protein [Bacillus cereus]PGO30043.1 hypothetical protein CN984_10980 [Bacillus cereus]
MSLKRIILIIFCFLLIGCSDSKTVTLQDFNNKDNVESIEITQGNSGKRADIRDKKEINEILSLFNKKKLKNIKLKDKIKGYQYSLKINYKYGDVVNIIVRGNILSVNNEYYEYSGDEVASYLAKYFK